MMSSVETEIADPRKIPQAEVVTCCCAKYRYTAPEDSKDNGQWVIGALALAEGNSKGLDGES